MFNTVKQKLFFGFGLMVLLMIFSGAFSYYNFVQLDDEADKMYLENTLPLPHLGDTGILFERIRVNIRDLYLDQDIATRGKYADTIKKISGEIHEHLAKVEPTLHGNQTKEAYGRLKVELDNFGKFGDELIELSKTGATDKEGIERINKECRAKASAVEKALDDLQSAKVNLAKGKSEHISSLGDRTRIVIIIATLFGMVAAGVAGLVIGRSILGPLSKMNELLEDIAQGDGDLTKRLLADGKDEFAETSRWFNLFVDKLVGIIKQIANDAASLAEQSTTLSTTAEQMAKGAEVASSNAANLATSSEEMSATSQDIASNCHSAASSADVASNSSKDGYEIAKRTTEGIRFRIGQTQKTAESISALGGRSDQIGAIVGTIEDIADQTNLLALNAAIEAARAGEMGRGFAVVADEVRALAERTTKATKEIGEMIRAMQSETKSAVDAMERGVSTSQSAIDDSTNLERALEDILHQVSNVTQQIAQIATAAEEQTATTHEISNSIQQTSSTLSETADGAHMTSTAAHGLDQLAENMKRVVSSFRW